MIEPGKLSSEVERRYTELRAAREDGMQSCAELKKAIALFRDLNLTHASSEGNLALKNARKRESEALKRYVTAVDLFSDAVLRAGGVVLPKPGASNAQGKKAAAGS